MKKIFGILLLLMVSIAIAEEDFRLIIKDNILVEINKSDWSYLSNEGTYDFFITKNSKHTGNGFHKVHTMVEFKEKDGRLYDNLQAPVKRIISYGYMSCEEHVFYLIGQLYLEVNDKIIYAEEHQFGTYRIEVTSPNTARNKAFAKVCILGKDA